MTTIVGLLDRRIQSLRAHDDAFDFAFWARGTISEIVAYLAGCGLLALHGITANDLNDVDAWPRATLQRTTRGDTFLDLARRSQADLFEHLGCGTHQLPGSHSRRAG